MHLASFFYRSLVITALLVVLSILLASSGKAQAIGSSASVARGVPFSELISQVRAKAKSLESSSGMRREFAAFVAAHHLLQENVRYSDFVIVRLLFEATRDAGFWNVHWSITDMPPNSD